MATDRTNLSAEEVASAEKAMQKKAELDANAKADQKAKELADKVAAAKAAKSPVQKLVEKYRKSYPDNKVFYVTSDMQVFLQSDQNLAILHQKRLKEGELETVKF